MNNISLGFSGDGFTMAENPIRDTLFAGNPDLYYTIGNASTMISAMALPMSGILKGATGAAKFKAIAVDGGRIMIGNVAEDKAYDAIYRSTDSRILAMLGSNVVEGVLSGNLANSSVPEIGDVDDLIALQRKGFAGVNKAENAISKIDEIEVKFNYKSKYNEDEFARQLADQEAGMNKLTVDEYLKNRERYIAEGRAIEGNIVQQAVRKEARAQKIAELRKNGLSYSEAKKQAEEWLKSQAVLHNPDQIAGGNPLNIGGMGDSKINSSIGSQWKYRIDAVDEQIKALADKMTETERKSRYLNIKLKY